MPEAASSLGIPDGLSEIVARARAADSVPPFADQSLVEVASGVRRITSIHPSAVAIVGDGEAELVVDPTERRQGHGARLIEHLVATSSSPLRIWAHGDLPGSRTLAERYGFAQERQLLHLRAAVAPRQPQVIDPRIGPFRAKRDAAAWVAMNARAFAEHPEQSRLTLDDFARLRENDWFDPADLLVLRDADTELLGACWLKIEDGIGEFYVVSVEPNFQGRGLGRSLIAAGLAHLAERGIHTASLYVEADNAGALALYGAFGFTRHGIDIQYSHGV